jgi:NDP-sugar pyrophosphorylase family protein
VLPSRALVLTAGLGTRLRPLTTVRAKPAIPIGKEPLVRRIIRWLVSEHVDELVLNLHHLPSTVTAAAGDGSDLGARVRYSWEPTLLGSAGGPRRAVPILAADRFFVVNGDTLTNVRLGLLADAHDRSGSVVTLALVQNREPGRYGGVLLDSRSRVTAFVRRGPDAVGSYHFVGVQLVEAEAFAGLPDGAPLHSIGGVYDRLLPRPGSICGFVCDADFFDVGTMGDYVRTAWSIADGTRGVLLGHRCEIAPTADVVRSILWDDVRVGEGSKLTDCIVTDGVSIPPGAQYTGVAIVRGEDGSSLATIPVQE